MYHAPQWAITDAPKRPFLKADLGALAFVACLATLAVVLFASFSPSLDGTRANSPYRVTSCTGGDVFAVRWDRDVWHVYELLDTTRTTVGYYGTRDEALLAAIRWCNG